ncbi:hypothetical protein IGI37_002199 [Enterococcus sp. AZ194]|uniref:hypothetical protein n=1 Tax=Enterococcus sp. AZ194 TaxID=2774629 RepID=UPI003F1F988F
MILFSKRKQVFMFGLTILICIIETFAKIDDSVIPIKNSGEGGLPIFYQMQSGGGYDFIGTICFFLWFILVPLLYSSQAIRARTNHFDFLLVSRFESSKKYWIRTLKTNAILTFIWMLTILVLRILLINIFYAPFRFEKVSFFLVDSCYYIVKNGFWNLVAFILFTCIGMTIFSTLILIIGMYLKNYVIYLPSGLVVGLFLIVAPVLLGTPLLEKHNSFLVSVLSINAIISPALQPVGRYSPTFNGGIVFFVSLFFYTLVCYLLFSLRLKLDKKNGF